MFICLILDFKFCSITHICLFKFKSSVFESEVLLLVLLYYLHPNEITWFYGNVAHFLQSRSMIEDALEVATDPDYRFDLAIQLGKLDVAKVYSCNMSTRKYCLICESC